MEMISEDVGLAKSDGLKAILFGGLIAGAMDITAASISSWIRSGRSPIWVFQSVAGGFYGAETFNGGYKTAALGLAIHFFIATTWAAVYYLASRKLKFMVSQAILSGVFYGIAVWLFMNLIVLPLSAWKTSPTQLLAPAQLSSVIIGILILVFCIGLPIALVVRRFSK